MKTFKQEALERLQEKEDALRKEGLEIANFFARGVSIAIEEIKSMQEEIGWVSVKDRLPPEFNWVLVTKGTNVKTGTCHLGKFYVEGVDGQVDGITHWMKYPEPPGIEVEFMDEEKFNSVVKDRNTFKLN